MLAHDLFVDGTTHGRRERSPPAGPTEAGHLPLLLDATLVTVYLSILSGIIGTIIGATCAIIRIMPLSFPNRVVSVYIWLMRGLPTLIFMLFVYYGLPAFSIVLDPFPAAMIALSLNAGAFWGETFRAAVEAVPSGQWDAGRALGLGFGPLMFKIILPQAFRIVVPPYLNGLITLARILRWSRRLPYPNSHSRRSAPTLRAFVPWKS